MNNKLKALKTAEQSVLELHMQLLAVKQSLRATELRSITEDDFNDLEFKNTAKNIVDMLENCNCMLQGNAFAQEESR